VRINLARKSSLLANSLPFLTRPSLGRLCARCLAGAVGHICGNSPKEDETVASFGSFSLVLHIFSFCMFCAVAPWSLSLSQQSLALWGVWYCSNAKGSGDGPTLAHCLSFLEGRADRVCCPKGYGWPWQDPLRITKISKIKREWYWDGFGLTVLKMRYCLKLWNEYQHDKVWMLFVGFAHFAISFVFITGEHFYVSTWMCSSVFSKFSP